MHFTVVFEAQESDNLSYGLVFVPCPVWKKGDEQMINLHPELPQYKKGDLGPLLSQERLERKFAEGGRRAVVVVHRSGHGTEEDLATLGADLKEAGFAVQEVRFR